jgi:hypothetical protein
MGVLLTILVRSSLEKVGSMASLIVRLASRSFFVSFRSVRPKIIINVIIIIIILIILVLLCLFKNVPAILLMRSSA